MDEIIDKFGGIGGIMQGLGAIAGAYGAYKGAKAQEKAADRAYKLNLSLLNEERARRNAADQALAGAFGNSNYAHQNNLSVV